jgi:membrane protein DedA with SNARE-associated domain
MATRRLICLSIAGVALWGGVFVLAGYACADTLANQLQIVGNVALGVCVAGVAVCALRRRFSHRRSASA